MVMRRIGVLALTAICGASAWGARAANAADNTAEWRAEAARVLAAHGDANSLAASAALIFLGPATRSTADTGKAAASALTFAARASELAPNDPVINWLRLLVCSNAPACDIREAATTLRWVDAENGAAWLPTLAAAQKDRDTIEIDRVLSDMAEGKRFDVYASRAAVLMFDAIKHARGALPKGYLDSDFARLTEAIGVANAAFIPSFSPLINACREAASATQREACMRLSHTMQAADAAMTQLAGFAIERRLTPNDAKELHSIAERRRLLEWRVSASNLADSQVLPWMKNARARSRLAMMRSLPREEDVCIAVLREHKISLEPPEDHP
jgi:hypothetical protein